jgi:hypothetical protein
MSSSNEGSVATALVLTAIVVGAAVSIGQALLNLRTGLRYALNFQQPPVIEVRATFSLTRPAKWAELIRSVSWKTFYRGAELATPELPSYRPQH